MSSTDRQADDSGEFVEDDPLTNREVDDALRDFFPRSQRRKIIQALNAAKLVVFHDDPC